MRKPSKKVRDLFAEVDEIAEQLLTLKEEEARLQETLERVWMARTRGMATLAAKAEIASAVEVAEDEARRKT